MAATFIELAIEVLSIVKKPLSEREIWDEANKMGISDRLKTRGKTPWRTLGARIYTDIKNNPATQFIQVSKRPARFYLKDLKVIESGDLDDRDYRGIDSDTQCLIKFHERDLHPLLVRFVYSNQHFRCHTKTIYHENPTKRQKVYNEWLHPDLVGIYFPFDDYSLETRRLQEAFKISSFKLFSFEMKVKLNFTNLRECYFQAVSNSSWAHEGYLVALDIEDDALLYDELRRLNNAFGIGVIKLNPMEVEQSEIIFPSKEREFIDMDTVDRLAVESKDFRCFINDMIEDIKIGKVKSRYDKVYRDDEYEAYIIGKGMKN